MEEELKHLRRTEDRDRLTRCEMAIDSLKEWQERQNGSLQRMEARISDMSAKVDSFIHECKEREITEQSMRESIRWMIKVQTGVLITVITLTATIISILKTTGVI